MSDSKIYLEKYHPLYSKAMVLMERCTNEDVPSDVFSMVVELSMDIFEDERQRVFSKPEKFILKLFKRI